MKPVDFDYERPATIEEALRLLGGRSAQTKILAGGQSLVPLLVTRALRPLFILDVGRIPELRNIRRDGGWIRIGAAVTQTDCAASPVVRAGCPLLAEAIGWVASPQVRNLGTVGGSLAQRNAISEIPTVAAAVGARLLLVDDQGRRREVAVEAFLDKDGDETLRPNELLLEAAFPADDGRGAWDFLEVQRRHAHYALVGVAVSFGVDAAGAIVGPRVAAGGIAPSAVRISSVENRLLGQLPSEALFEDVSGLAVSDPRMQPADDLHATADYRRRVTPAVIRRSLSRALARCSAA